jgi:hypothetical protein
MGSSDSEDSEHSHITVVITPEDLYAACTTACTPERCDNATMRPLEPPYSSIPNCRVPLFTS